jgi:hypothetical protein
MEGLRKRTFKFNNPHSKQFYSQHSDKVKGAQDLEKLKGIAIVYIAVFIDILGSSIVLPILPLYGRQFGADSITIGLIFTSYQVYEISLDNSRSLPSSAPYSLGDYLIAMGDALLFCSRYS